VHDEIRPVMAVHDELVLDVLDGMGGDVACVVRALEGGARQRIGQPYRTGMITGNSYAECKGT
jgi:hypothetical protein